ncbi:hypothetical protein [Pseudomonas baetica]|uniref:hypothetical protein n=1 Tax=Pseudomonas baetica TaxID=674054 RepID=UPI0024067A4D|nr:hypothetical protein [Pseudomonas baetica]MDF9779319.1 hypothetical protein [Pseudomonas baetica]
MDTGLGTLERSTEDSVDDAYAVKLTLDHSFSASGNHPHEERKPPHFVVPNAFSHPMTMEAAWSAWYGSQKEVSAIADRLMKIRHPKLTSAHAAMKRARQPAVILVNYLGIAEYCLTLRESSPDDFCKVAPSNRLDANLIQLLGQEERDRIKSLCSTGPATNVIDAVVALWPFMRSLFDVGAFNRDLAFSLLFLSKIEKLGGDGLPKLNQPDRYRRDMAAALLLNEIPEGIFALVFDSSPYLAGLLKVFAEVRSRNTSLPDKIDPHQQLHLQLSHSQLAELVEDVHSTYFGLTSKTAAGVPRLLAQVEGQALALRPGRNALSIIYSQFVDGFARQEWLTLVEALNSHAQSMEVSLDQKLFAADLVGRDIGMPKNVSLEAVDLIRRLIITTQDKLDAGDFIARADKQLSKVRDLHGQIATLGQNLTVQAMGKIQDLAGSARDEILANRGWFQTEVDRYIPLIRAWQRFYEEWERQYRKGASPTPSKTPTALTLVERLPAPAATPAKQVTPDLVELHEELETALTHNNQLERELGEARTEIFNLRASRESLPATDTSAVMPQADMDLLRRVAFREALTPVDVLAFIQFVASDRVVVLESAWKSAREAAAFQYAGRMLDALKTMVFPYFESLKNGNPDSVAKELLAGAYSAKESHSVGSSTKLRSLREFVYEGQVHFFERHLRIGNGGGMEGMRLHFDIFNGEKIVIAYAGPHLECPSTT